MSYIGKNPKFNSTVLTDVGLAAVDSPASGSHKLVNRGGTVKIVDSAGSESSLGGGSGEINLVDNSSDAGNWGASGAGVTVATTTTATDLPLGGVVDTAIKLTPVSGADYARYRFTMPAGLKNRKLKIEWFQRPLSGYASGDFKVEMYKNAASNYSGAYTEFNLSTDSSGVTSIPNATGKFTTTFDADDGDYYELRYVRVAGTTALNLASVIVGPGTQPQGAVVGPFLTSIVPVAGWFGTGPTNVTTVVKQRQDGTTVDLKYSVVATGTSAVFSELTLNLPLGLTIDTSALSLQGSGRAPVGTFQLTKPGVGNHFGVVYYEAGLIVCRYILDTSPAPQSVTNASPVAWNTTTNPTSIHIEINALPIAEWAGSGTVNLAQNDVEYASNTAASGGTGANDLVSFAYGPSGSLIGSISTAIVRRVRFQTPIKPSDTLVLEFSNDRVTWWPVTSIATVGGGDFGQGTTRQGSFFYGAGIYNNNANGTDLDVQFGNYAAVSNSASYAAAGIAWSASAGSAYWRVKKQAAGAAVGFGLADTSGNSGLVNPYNTGSASVVVGGTYTPTVSNNVNCAVTAFACHYLRVGPIVTVSGQFLVDVVAAGVTEYLITLPIASNFTTSRDAQGTCAHGQVGGVYDAGQIFADAGTDKVLIGWRASGVDLAAREQGFIFTYIIK